MTKKDFEKYINEQFKNIPIKKIEHDLTKMKNVWLPQILDKIYKNQIQCKSCGNYLNENDFKIEIQKEIHTEITYDKKQEEKIGRVEYIVTYNICPICENKEIKSKEFIRNIKSWNYKKYLNLGYIFRILRITNNFSQTDLAKITKLSQVYIGELERNEKSPSQLSLKKLLSSFNITNKQLVELIKYYETLETKTELQKYQLMLIKSLEITSKNNTSEV